MKQKKKKKTNLNTVRPAKAECSHVSTVTIFLLLVAVEKLSQCGCLVRVGVFRVAYNIVPFPSAVFYC